MQPTTANSEIVRVTAISTDTFTITRAQESTSARTIVVGDQIADTITVKTLTDVELDRSYLTSTDQTVLANTQVIYEGYLELAASFEYELAVGAVLVIGDFATPIIGPGYEFNYTQITAGVNVASTTEATGTTIFSPGPIMFDGSPVLVHFFSPAILTDTAAAADDVIVSMFEATTQIGRIANVRSGSTTQARLPVSAFYRFTPTAGYHTYTITAHATSTTGTPQVAAGAGGVATPLPAFVRFTKV